MTKRSKRPTNQAEAMKLPTKPVKPAPTVKTVVSLRVFLQIHGAKADQLAGFKSHATRAKLKPMSVPEWRAAHQAFMDKPVR